MSHVGDSNSPFAWPPRPRLRSVDTALPEASPSAPPPGLARRCAGALLAAFNAAEDYWLAAAAKPLDRRAADAGWMPDAMALFTWCLHSISTHEIRFTGPDEAVGRVHLFNRNGLEWEGEPELLDVGGRYLDEYVRTGDRWRFARRVEDVSYIEGGKFAAVVRDLAAKTKQS